MKNKKYHTVGTFPKSNRKILEMGKIDTLNTHILYIYIHDCSLSWPDKYRHFKKKKDGRGGKLFLWAKPPLLIAK